MNSVAYIEEDGHTPDHDIVTYFEKINGHQVGFIKYRTAGLLEEPEAMPRTCYLCHLYQGRSVAFCALIRTFSRASRRSMSRPTHDHQGVA